MIFLPIRLLAIELQRSCCWKQYLQYQKALHKLDNNILRVKFLDNCKRADVIPRFLKFRIPSNGCFDEKSIHTFQKTLLNKELQKAKTTTQTLTTTLNERRQQLRSVVPEKALPSVILHTRIARNNSKRQQDEVHNSKLAALSEEQQRPLFNVSNTVVLCGLETTPPKYVMETLALGPKNAILDKFDPKDLLAEIDALLHHCKTNKVADETITDINVKTLAYIKRCKQMKPSKNIQMTKRYLKDHDLLAVPFDKGIGICIMKREDYHSKMDKIIALPQFEKLEKLRKNAKHPVLKEEDRVVGILKSLQQEKKIDDDLYEKLRPRGSQPARLYGLAKVHKTDTPMRPVLSMPGSAYHKVAEYVAQQLANVPQCKINTSTDTISKKIRETKLEEDEEMISFDVVSLYTNVPVLQAIEVCTDMLYKLPP